MVQKRLCLGALSALSLCICSFSASADFYAGALVGYPNAEFKHPSSSTVTEASPYFLQGQVGYFFNDYIGLEARYGTSVQRDSGIALDSIASAFAKFNMPVTERVAVYGLAGYSSIRADKQNIGSETEQGFGFGLGVHYALNNENAVTFEFVDSMSGDQIRLNSLNIGFQHKF